MTSQVLFRTDAKLKQAFQAKLKTQGLSMDYVLNLFIRAYIEDPSIVKVNIDMEKFVEITKRLQ